MGAFTACQGYTLGIVATAYAPQTIALALVLTCTAVAGAAATARALRHRDLSLFGLALGACGWVLLAAMLVWAFLLPASAAAATAISAAGACLFVLYLVFDVWLMQSKRGLAVDEYMLAAMLLYMDVLNLFLFILRLLGNGGDRH